MTGSLLVFCLDNCILISSLHLGYDASAVSGTGFSAFTSCGASGPETPKYPCNQQWADKISWLWPCTNLQFSDGSYLSGKFLEAFIFLLMQQCAFLFWFLPFYPIFNTASKAIAASYLCLQKQLLYSQDWSCFGYGVQVINYWLLVLNYIMTDYWRIVCASFLKVSQSGFGCDTDFFRTLNQICMVKVFEVPILRENSWWSPGILHEKVCR